MAGDYGFKSAESVILYARLMMSAPLSGPYNPYLSTESFRAEAVPLLEQMEKDFEKSQSHEVMMLAKIQLGKLYCLGHFGTEEFEKAASLWWEVVNVPEEKIVFDLPGHLHLNLDVIAKARANVKIAGLPDDEAQRQAMIERIHQTVDLKHRERLLEERQSVIESLRIAAIRQLTYDLVEPERRMRTRDRLMFLKQQRLDDSFYQKTIDDILQDFQGG
ncbi:MAG: hypothetical protein JW787_16005 [Sedimentisphaerales bacterium]|nr:hypothetical protein [Sedimentisphaerales bacterium]